MIDKQFSLKNIEEATLCLNDCSDDQESIINFLNEWCEQPNSIFSALELIQSSDNFTSRFIGSSLIKNKIQFCWNQIDPNQKSQYRDSLTSIIYSTTDINDNISYNLIHSLCTIAIFDWPDDYSTFIEILLDNFEFSEKNIITIRILSSFFDDLDFSDIITNNHRNELRQLIQTQYLEQIKYVINTFLLIPEFSNDILTICNCFIRWFSLEEILNLELFDQIVILLKNEITCENSVKCLRSIFINDEKNEESLCIYSPFLIHSLSLSIYDITLSCEFLIFLIDFLKGYSKHYQIVLILDQILEFNPIFTDDIIKKLSNNLKENGIENEILFNDLTLLYKTVFNIPPNEINDELRISFQNLCENLLRDIYNDSINDWQINEMGSFVDSLYDDLFLSVYNCQNYFDYNEGEIAYQMNSMLKFMYLIDSDYYLEFLNKQQPTPQLCWAIGSIQKHVDESQYKNFISILIDLIECLENDQSPAFISSLLYALSNWACCFNLYDQLFVNFNNLVFDSLTQNDENLSFSASSSFYETVMNHAVLYKNDCLQFIELITNNCCEYLSNLNEKSSEKMIISCTKLIRYFKHQVNQSKSDKMTNFDSSILYQQLFNPFIEVLNNINDFQLEIIEASLNIIGKVCSLSKETANDLIEIIWPHLITLAYNAIPDLNISSILIELIMNTIAKIQIKFDYDTVSPQIVEIFKLMTQRGRIEDCYFIYFAKLKRNFKEIKEIYEQIHQQMVLPYILTENTASSEMFKMIEKFDFDVVDIEWFTEILIETIKNMSTDVVYSGLKAFIKLISNFSITQLMILFIKNLGAELIKTIIEAIFDLLHKPLLFKFSEFINKIIYKIKNINDTYGYDDLSDEKKRFENNKLECLSIIKNSISSTLFELSPEPKGGFFNNFVEFLFTHEADFEIMNAFSNLLIILRKASPCDFDCFKIEQIDDEFSEDDYDSNIEDFIEDID